MEGCMAVSVGTGTVMPRVEPGAGAVGGRPACPWMALSGTWPALWTGPAIAAAAGAGPAAGGWLGGCQGVAGSAGASANVGALPVDRGATSSSIAAPAWPGSALPAPREMAVVALPQRPAPPARPAPSRPCGVAFPPMGPRTAPGRAPCAPSALSAFPGCACVLRGRSAAASAGAPDGPDAATGPPAKTAPGAETGAAGSSAP